MKPQKRIDNPETIDEALVESELLAGKQVTIQFSSSVYNSELLIQVNKLCYIHDENLVIRFYGHYGQTFDCSVVEQIPNVKALSIDCIINATNEDSVYKLKYLKRFGIGVYELKNKEFLNHQSLFNLDELFLSDTKNKNLNLEHLVHYKNLTYLIVCGHTKNINAIKHLTRLEKLRLNSISKVPLPFVNNLSNLKFLSITLGGRDNILEVVNPNIEELELVWIRGLNDVSNLSRFTALKSLRIEDQIRLQRVHFEPGLKSLEDVKILNCKTLENVTGLANLPKLHQLRIYQTNIDFDQFIEQPLPSLLSILAFYTTRSKRDEEIKNQLLAMGYTDGLER